MDILEILGSTILSAIFVILAISYFWGNLTSRAYALSVAIIYLSGVAFGTTVITYIKNNKPKTKDGGKNE